MMEQIDLYFQIRQVGLSNCVFLYTCVWIEGRQRREGGPLSLPPPTNTGQYAPLCEMCIKQMNVSCTQISRKRELKINNKNFNCVVFLYTLLSSGCARTSFNQQVLLEQYVRTYVRMTFLSKKNLSTNIRTYVLPAQRAHLRRYVLMFNPHPEELRIKKYQTWYRNNWKLRIRSINGISFPIR